MAEIIHEQDGIKYKINGDSLRWSGTVLFKKPLWNGNSIIEGWTQADQDAEDDRKVKDDKIKDHINSDSTIWVGKTPDGIKDYAVVIDNSGKLSTVEII